MKLLKIHFDHLTMFEDGIFEIDLFASDRVTASDESAFELADHLYVNSVVALAGINATGKTTAARPISSVSYGTQATSTCSNPCCKLPKEATTALS